MFRHLRKFFPDAVDGDIPQLQELCSVSALVFANAAGPLACQLLPLEPVAGVLQSLRRVKTLSSGTDSHEQGSEVIEVELDLERSPVATYFSPSSRLWDAGQNRFAMKLQKRSKQSWRWQACSEVITLLNAKHPFIIKLHQAFQAGPYYVLLLELCSGGDLDGQLGKKDPITGVCSGLPVERAARYAGQVLFALVYLHEACKMVYRDLKPANILLSEHDEAKLADFGLAVYVGSGHCELAPGRGSPGYAAPEMAGIISSDLEGNPEGAFDWYKLDAYSFGVTLLLMLVGQVNGTSVLLEEGSLQPQRVPSLLDKELARCCEMGRLSEEASKLLFKLLPESPSQRTRLAHESIRQHCFFLNALQCEDMETFLLDRAEDMIDSANGLVGSSIDISIVPN
eukprot:TRINITY_DN27870_c0_g1_i1.p1 TRINITY_DN27870_c0_g1~~TRINITY_DN27870_c0_g1_i1.p1  ORF type:complete len:417 (-),score=69.75 TRINITY_DN27870_c0_g1_i1:132-1322(-)